MLIFLLILFIILASVELYVRGRISFIISKPFVPFSRVSTRRAKRISFFLDLISVVAVSIFTFADARTSCSSRFFLEFYMKYSVYDSLFFKYPFNVWRVVCGCLFSLFCSDGLDWIGLDWLGLAWIGLAWLPSRQIDSNLRSLAHPRHMRLLWLPRFRSPFLPLLIRSAIATSSSRLPSGSPDSSSPSMRSTSSSSSPTCVSTLPFIASTTASSIVSRKTGSSIETSSKSRFSRITIPSRGATP